MFHSKIVATAMFAPPREVTNEMLSQHVDTSDDWVRSRTGIEKRRFVVEESLEDMASGVAKSLLEKSGLDPLDIDMILVATLSGDYSTPSAACLVQKNTGAKNAFAMDINAACSGFIYAMSVADKFIKSGQVKHAIVIGAEVLSKLMNFQKRDTAVLFGDGAGGVILSKSGYGGILGEDIGSDGTKGLALTAGHIKPGDRLNPDYNPFETFNQGIDMDGRAVFDFATRIVPATVNRLLEKTNFTMDDVSYIIPHQANYRIVTSMAKKLKQPIEKFYINIHEYGNTSAASVPIALHEAVTKKHIVENDKFIITGFGGGLTWGSMLIQL